jgi:hypothetical protein
VISLQCLAISVGLAFLLSLIEYLPERKKLRVPVGNNLPPISGEIIINLERS